MRKSRRMHAIQGQRERATREGSGLPRGRQGGRSAGEKGVK